MATNHKQAVTMNVTGLRLTDLGKAKLGQAVLIEIYKHTDVIDSDAIKVTFTDEF
jgi:hypothetical protein